MSYTVAYPLGKRVGPGSFETFYGEKYNTLEQALRARDVVIVHFVKDNSGALSFQAYHVARPGHCLYRRLQFPRMVAGMDVSDERAAMELAAQLL